MSKSSKSTLKEAREYLAQKNYKETLRICKKILKEDRSNYGALILLSAAMREVEDLKSQSLIALKKAVQVQPDNPLAWRGIVCYYEKEPDSSATWSELILAYCKLLQFDRDSPKYEHYLNSCSELVICMKDDSVFMETVSCFHKIRNIFIESQDYKLKLLDATLVSLLTQNTKLPSEYNDLLESALSSVLKENDSNYKQEYYKRYLKILYKLEKYDVLMSEAVKMYEMFPQDTYPLEWICRTYSEQSILNDKYENFDVMDFYEKLLSLNKNSIFALLAKAVQLYRQQSFIESRNILNHVISAKSLLYGWILLSDVNLKLYCWELAEQAALKAQKLIPENSRTFLTEKINVNLIESLTKSNKKQKWQMTVLTFDQLLSRDVPKHLLLLTRAYILTENQQANDTLKQLESYPDLRVESTILRAIFLMKHGKLEQAADVLDIALCTSEAWLLLGKIYWQLTDFGHSLMAFLKAVHADPNNWECLVYLGNYYKEHGSDLERSKKCYQKALQINPNAEEAGVALSTVYRLLKDYEANEQLLKRLTAEGGGPKWAWLQLGLQKLHANDPNEAVKFLRCAIRTDPNDCHCWETLADAYFARGAYTSSIKSYQRALKLYPESHYSMMQVANIKLLLGQYEEAKEDFERVICKKEDSSVAALKGLAETHLGLAKNESEKQLLARVRDNIQSAVDHLTLALSKRNDLFCLWKLLGNACHFMAKMPDKYCYMYILPEFIMSEHIGENIKIDRQLILQCCVRCYCRALNLSKDSSLLWHDLAIGYLAQLKLDSSVDRCDIVKRCLFAAKHAVRLCPSSWTHWNLLGVICMSDEITNYALAQHCFVMAIDLEYNNAISWSNLGSLYLLLGDLYRANEAFSWAQRADPGYINSWVGQALIAEKVVSREAMDLFRHATQMGYHSQSAIGYAHWVISTLLNSEAKDSSYTYSIINMHAVSVAIDSIGWYIVHFPNDPYALNICGLLFERQKLYKSAEQHFYAALRNVQNDIEKDAIATNLSRVMINLGEYNKAVELCQGIKSTSFRSHCQLALALFKAERYEESYLAYEVTLEWLADADSDKAHVLCAMAAMAYMFESVDDVKTLLFQCIEFKPRIVSGLLAAAALGLLHNDINLTSLILKELEAFKDYEDYRHHIVLLSAYLAFIQYGVHSAVRTLVKIIHRHPGDARLWMHLVRFLVDMNIDAFQTCAKKALFLGKDLSELNITQVASLASFSDFIKNPNKGLRSILKTVHSFTGCIESWANLITALLPRCSTPNSQPSAHWLTILTWIVRKKLSTSKEMTQWLLKIEEHASLIADKVAITTV